MTTISASSTVGIVLSSPSYANPVSINPGVTISSGGNAVYAPSLYWTIQNGGLIAGNPAAPPATANAAGIRLFLGGDITNQSTATITGYHGIYADYGNGPKPTNVLNFGSIGGNPTFGDGVYLGTGGSVTNQSGGSISGYHGISGQSLTVVNDGSIAGNTLTPNIGAGVDLHAGGAVTNQSDGFISGRFGVISDKNGAVATVVNAGYIAGSLAGSPNSGVGVLLGVGGLVINQIGGTISGYSGIQAGYYGAATVVNAGTISGITNSVGFTAGQTNRLVADPGAVFKGTVNGGNVIGAGVIRTLELASGASSGTLSGLGTQFINFGSIALDTGADWFVAGNTSGLAGTISGFAAGDTIEITGITATGSNYAGGVLTLTEASGSAILDLPGNFTTNQFVVTNVAGGAEVSLACFRSGTRIRTERGEVVVEQLLIGDRVDALLGGVPAPIVWIGHRIVDCRNHPDPKQVWPVLIRAGAFGLGLPCRDLFLSPDHAVFVDDVLIPVKHLINGKTIDQVSMDEVTYYHVELPQHDVLLAEGLPAESYLDTNDRSDFANGGGPITLYPNFSVRMWEAMGCAPLVLTGPILEAARRRMNARLDRPELFRSAAA